MGSEKPTFSSLAKAQLHQTLYFILLFYFLIYYYYYFFFFSQLPKYLIFPNCLISFFLSPLCHIFFSLLPSSPAFFLLQFLSLFVHRQRSSLPCPSPSQVVGQVFFYACFYTHNSAHHHSRTGTHIPVPWAKPIESPNSVEANAPRTNASATPRSFRLICRDSCMEPNSVGFHVLFIFIL